MPNCFRLIDKVTGEPETLNKVDEKICEAIGVPVHEREWCFGWYNYIGFLLALGKHWDEIEKGLNESAKELNANIGWTEAMLKILAFLRENYESDAWYERKV